MEQQDLHNIQQFYQEENIIFSEYEGTYINMNKLMEYEDDPEYFDNTMDILDRMDTITIEADEKVSFSLRELCNIDEDLIYHVGRKDGLQYVGNLIDHIYHGGYSGEK